MLPLEDFCEVYSFLLKLLTIKLMALKIHFCSKFEEGFFHHSYQDVSMITDLSQIIEKERKWNL